MKNILFALFLAILISCNQRDEKDKGILRIDIESGIDNIDISINLSDYIESITYCRLETRPDFLIGDRPEFSLTDNEVVVKTFDDCYIFERKTESCPYLLLENQTTTGSRFCRGIWR